MSKWAMEVQSQVGRSDKPLSRGMGKVNGYNSCPWGRVSGLQGVSSGKEYTEYAGHVHLDPEWMCAMPSQNKWQADPENWKLKCHTAAICHQQQGQSDQGNKWRNLSRSDANVNKKARLSGKENDERRTKRIQGNKLNVKVKDIVQSEMNILVTLVMTIDFIFGIKLVYW